MKKLIYLLACYLLSGSLNAKEYYYLTYKNHTQNTFGSSGQSHNSINVIANIGDSVTLYPHECDLGGCDIICTGPWLFNGDTIAGSNTLDTLTITITQAGTYSVMGFFFFGSYQFHVCLPPVAPPAAPASIYGASQINCSINSVKTYWIISMVPCATSYTWINPPGTTILSNYGTNINLHFTSLFTGDTLRLTANNSIGSSSETKLMIECLSSVGIQDLASSEEFILFPNPFVDYFELRISDYGINKKCEIKILDVMGKECPLSPPKGDLAFTQTGSVKINMQGFSAGVYFVQVTANGMSSTQKVVKY